MMTAARVHPQAPGPDELAARAAALLADPDVARMFSALKVYDPGTAAHSLRTALLADLVGSWCGVRGARRTGLGHAGLLHDVGKLTVPRTILNHPGALSAPQRSIICGHARAGQDLVALLGCWPVDVPGWVGAHHERIDGSGYPTGSRRQPREVRILAVVDVLDALSAARPYREALGFAGALDVLAGPERRRYDQRIVAAVRALVEQGLDLRDYGGAGPG